MPITFHTDPENPSSLYKVQAQVAKAYSHGKPLKVVISSFKGRRSSGQNDRLWAIYGHIQDWVFEHGVGDNYPKGTFWATVDIHNAMRHAILKKTVNTMGHPVPVSTASLTSDVFGAYMDEIIRRSGSDYGVSWEGW